MRPDACPPLSSPAPTSPAATFARPRRRRGAFVLLEVLVSLAIMGIAISMVLQSLTISLKAARASERITMASILARDLIEQWEVKPPPVGETDDGFGDENPRYSYRVDYTLEKMDYEDIFALEEGRLAYFRLISLDIYHQTKSTGSEKKRLLHIESALSSAERYTQMSKIKNEKGFDD